MQEGNGGENGGGVSEELVSEKRDGKSAKDPGYSLRDWFKGGGWVQAGGKYDGKPCAKQPGQKTKPFCRDADDRAAMSKDERDRRASKKRKEDPNPDRKGKAKMVSSSYQPEGNNIDERADFWDPDPKKDRRLGGPGANQRAREDGASSDSTPKKDYSNSLKPGETYMQFANRKKAEKMRKEEIEVNEAKDRPGKGSGKKDACYHKVKSRYSVWPSAYASGALVKCRKKGAANWGNSDKKEEFMALPEFTDLQINSMRKAGIEVEVLDEKCWVGYTQKGMKKKGNKMVPNCVPVGEETKEKEETIEEATRVPAQNGNVYLVGFTWRGKYMMMKIFFPEVRKPARSEVQDALEKVYPGSFVKHFYLAPYDPSEPMLNVGVKEEVEIEEDWQKVNKSDKTDGMSKKAVAAYRRENPGSKLKTAVTGDPKPGSKDAKRRKSYCSRSAGQQKMHNIDCSKTPDKAICKARRRWKC